MTNVKKGIKSLQESVKRDCEKGEGCFNPNGCDHEFTRIVPEDNPKLQKYSKTKCISVCKCTHKYCDKYAYVMKKAAHYEKYFGVPAKKFIEKWESKRTYWYMNYYQGDLPDFDKQIKEGKLKIFDTVADLQKSVGKEFRCPACEGVSTDAYACTCDGCDWKSYGLFGTMGKGVNAFVKENLEEGHFFMPIAWEKQKATA